MDDEADLLNEIRARKEAFAAKHDFDVERMIAALQTSARGSGLELVPVPPRLVTADGPVVPPSVEDQRRRKPSRQSKPLMSRSERASQIWAVLAWAAKNRQTLTYAQVGKLIGVPAAGLGRLLEPIQSYCLIHNLPPLTILVVQQDTGLPGHGFAAASASEYAEAQSKVFKEDWLEHGNPQPDVLERSVLERPSLAPRP